MLPICDQSAPQDKVHHPAVPGINDFEWPAGGASSGGLR